MVGRMGVALRGIEPEPGSTYITYISVSKPTQGAVAGPRGHLASIVLPTLFQHPPPGYNNHCPLT